MCKHQLYSLKNSRLRFLINGQNSLESWKTDLPELTNFVKIFQKTIDWKHNSTDWIGLDC